MKEQGLMASTIILTTTSFVTRTIGMVSIIYISNTIGSEGMGLYQLIMSIYSMAIIFACAGISVSVSKIIAEEISQMHFYNISKVMHIAFVLSGILSIIACFILLIFTDEIARLFVQDNRIIWGIKMFSLSVPFIALSSCLKGYFYAVKKALYPASADVLEQFVKLGLIITLVGLSSGKGLSSAYGAIGIGITIGEMVSFSYMLTLYLLDRRQSTKNYTSKKTTKTLLFRMLKLILPIALIAYISSLFMSIENILIPFSLRKFGSSAETSMSVYGMLKGMVLPILFFPSAFLTAFSTTLIPEISRANALNHHKRVAYTTNRVLQFTFILSMLIVSVFTHYSSEIGLVFYKNEQVGQMLRILAFTIPFMYIEVVTDGILKGLGVQICCLKYSIIDSLFRITTIYFLLPIRGISAFMGIMIMSNILTSTLNFNNLLEETRIKIQFSNWIIKPTITATASGLFSKMFIKYLIPSSYALSLKLSLGILLTVSLYVIFLFLVEALNSEDISWLKKQFNRFSLRLNLF